MSEKTKEKDEKSEKAEKPKGGKKKLILGIIAIVIIVNLVIVGRIMMSHGKKAPAKPVVEEVGLKMNLDEFLVNLQGSGDHYLRATIALGLKKDLTEEKVKEDIAPIRDAIVSVLCSKKLEDLSTEEGKEKLRTEAKERINRELGDEKVVKVYLTSFATQ